MTASNYVNGKWVPTQRGLIRELVDPSTGHVFSEASESTESDVDEAVAAAKLAFRRGWSDSRGVERAIYLRRIAARIRELAESFAQVESRNVGKPRAEARLDVSESIECFEYYAGLAEKLDDVQERNLVLSRSDYASIVRREAVGVVALIVPWNFPLLLASWKVAPALAAGCTIVLKPSELTPLSAIELARVVQSSGLPEGVFNLLTGDGPSCGRSLVKHPDVDKISFTGSGATGGAIQRDTSSAIRPTTLELGGKSPMLIFDDSDLESAVQWTLVGAFANSGQICSATSRVLVARSIYDRFIELLVGATKEIQVGRADDDRVQMGPLIGRSQLDKVASYASAGRSEGKLIFGGSRTRGLEGGYFFDPTVFCDVERSSRLWNEEIFGPVLCINKFDTEDEAIEMANDTRFGLAAAVMSRDSDRCRRVARRLCAGVVWTNCSQPVLIEAPWGGWKQSGVGTELGTWGLESYLLIKQITQKL